LLRGPDTWMNNLSLNDTQDKNKFEQAYSLARNIAFFTTCGNFQSAAVTLCTEHVRDGSRHLRRWRQDCWRLRKSR
jgi:hypothetical protein